MSEQFKLTSADEWVADFINNKSISSQDHVRKIQLEAIKHGIEYGAKMARDGWSLETILTAAKEFKL